MSTILLALMASFFQVDAIQGQADTEALIKRIKENQVKVDEVLLEASEVDAVVDQIARARQLHLDIIRDLEELIREAKYQRSNQSSGSPPPQDQDQQQSSQDQGQPPPRPSDGSEQRPPQSTQRDDMQSQREQQQQQGEQENEQRQESEQPAGSPPQNEPGARPPPDETRPFTRENTDGRWGLLPPKVQEDLMNLHVDDVPDRYRSWLEAYIRAMHRLEEP